VEDMSDMFDDDDLSDMIDRQMREARRPHRIAPGEENWRNTLWVTRDGQKVRKERKAEVEVEDRTILVVKLPTGKVLKC
jgi:hypothetical protein